MTQPSIAIGLWRGFTGRCPNCGKGALLHRYLKVTSPCPTCGHDNAQYPSDDAPPYFTILIIGHLDVVEARREDWTTDPFNLSKRTAISTAGVRRT